MKNSGKKVAINLCIIYIIMLLTGYLSISFVYMIPTRNMAKHIFESSEVFEKEGVYPQLIAGHEDSILDNWTDAIMLMIAGYTGGESAFVEAVHNGYQRIIEKNPAESLITISSEKNVESNVIYYSRYWHGYVIYLKPLLLFFRYQEIRYLLGAVQLSLIIVIVVLFVLKKMIKAIIPFMTAYLFFNPATLLLSLQYNQIFMLLLLQFIVILWFDRVYKRMKNIWIYHFFIVGCLTSFFDFLTYPLVSFGITGAFLIFQYTKTAKDATISFLKVSCSWGCGYLFMWAGKWMIGSVILNRNMFSEALSVFQTRSGYETADEKFSYTDVLLRNFGVRKVFLLILGILTILCMMIRIWKKIKFKWKDILLVAFAILPFGWFFIAANHSYIHYWFAYREIAVTVYALTLAGVEAITRRPETERSRFQYRINKKCFWRQNQQEDHRWIK